jgi:hypothetical protein
MESGEAKAPTRALSIRQPWAWLIVAGFKDIENRTWATNYRGPIYIHASKGMTAMEYREAILFMHSRGIHPAAIPMAGALDRGGIIGAAEITDCVNQSTCGASRWFTGPHGFMIRNARPLPFFRCAGALGFFPAWHPSAGGGIESERNYPVELF